MGVLHLSYIMICFPIRKSWLSSSNHPLSSLIMKHLAHCLSANGGHSQQVSWYHTAQKEKQVQWKYCHNISIIVKVMTWNQSSLWSEIICISRIYWKHGLWPWFSKQKLSWWWLLSPLKVLIIGSVIPSLYIRHATRTTKKRKLHMK